MHPGDQTSPLGFEGCAGRGKLLSVAPLRSPMCFPSGVVEEQGTPLRLLLALMQNTQHALKWTLRRENSIIGGLVMVVVTRLRFHGWRAILF
jgi:hypothetical protein